MATTINNNLANEARRLAELRAYDILDTEEEKEFTDLVELASGVAGMPISLITLLDEKRQWFKARIGLDLPETSRDIAFCNYAIQGEGPLVVQNALQDERFRTNPLVTGSANIRSYAGFPLVTPAGSKLGTLCVLDSQPRTLSSEKMAMLAKLADKVVQILELRRRNKELATLKAEAEAQRDMMDKLLDNQRKMMSILAHDTKGPLTSMAHLVTMLADTNPLDEGMKDMALGLMSGQLKVTLDLIDNLIFWGASQLAAQMYEEEAYDPAAVATEAYRGLARLAEEKEISCKIEEAAGTRFRVNREMLRFIIRNLLHNSFKFTEKGTVDVWLGAEDGHSIIRISDTGIGMSIGVKDKLFNKKMASRDGTRKEPGSGLGLLLVYDFVVKMGGEIQVESVEGKGTTFTISFQQEPGVLQAAVVPVDKF